MATHHAAPNEVVDLATWATELEPEKTKVIFRTEELEVARLVMPKGKEFKEHQVTGPITVQCITGEIISTAMGHSQRLKPGQLLYLLPNEPHALTAQADSVILLTIIFKP